MKTQRVIPPAHRSLKNVELVPGGWLFVIRYLLLVTRFLLAGGGLFVTRY